MPVQRTLFEKVWDAHTVTEPTGRSPIIYIDLHLVHEVTSPQAFEGLRAAGRRVRRPERTLATVDHNVPTEPRGTPITDPIAARQIQALQENCKEFRVRLFDIDSPEQGIVHVIGPELGLTQPGMTIVCGDSHTSTHGAFGALAFGIGTSEVEHVLATQCLAQRKPKTMKIKVSRRLPGGVTAKDLALGVIGQIGTDGATGYVIEYAGEVVRGLSMEGRMTLCNMSIEAGARAAMIAPDETTFAYVKGRRFAPQGDAWDEAIAHWRTLATDPGAQFDRVLNGCGDARTICDLGNESRDGCAGHRSRTGTRTAAAMPTGVRPSRRSNTWGWSRERRLRTLPSIECSLARAPTRGSKICALQREWPRAIE